MSELHRQDREMTNEKVWALKGRHMLTLADWTRAELDQILDLARRLKGGWDPGPHLARKTLALLFTKPSTRTRTAFQVAMTRLGGESLFLDPRDLQLQHGESLAETARVLGNYVDGIAVRTYAHEDAETIARHASVPVINALTDLLHPCEILADLFTLQEHLGDLSGRKLCYVGDGNNICNSLLQGGAVYGMHVAVACPKGYEPNPGIIAEAQRSAAQSGGSVWVGHEAKDAAADADVVYTDAWASMGQKDSAEERRSIFQPYQVNRDLMNLAKSGALFLHCLPARRGEEVTADVLDGPQSIAGAASKNILFVQQAVLALLLKS